MAGNQRQTKTSDFEVALQDLNYCLNKAIEGIVSQNNKEDGEFKSLLTRILIIGKSF